MFNLTDFQSGDRVQLHPATDLWMRGARYGEVVRTTSLRVHVRLDATGMIARLRPENIGEILPYK